ncbi:MAG TPA: nuclear transport factor 2 family protein [Pseudonocardia sp.]|jgi:hypothetical protein
MAHTLERLDAEDQITRLIHAYCTGIDTGNLDDTAQLFTDGTWYLNPDTPFTGFAAVSGFLRDNVLLYDGVPATRHTITNIRIDVADGPEGVGDTARANCYVAVYQAAPGRAPEVIFVGSYDDTFARDAGTGRWRFADRVINTLGVGDMSRHLRAAGSAAL